jgi:hypothetical protein
MSQSTPQFLLSEAISEQIARVTEIADFPNDSRRLHAAIDGASS